MPQLLAEIDKRATELAAGFAVDIGDLPSRERILSQAQSVLRDIALETQLRNVTGTGRRSANDEESGRDLSAWKEWLDEDLALYNRRYLDRALPKELQQAHADGAAVGLLKVDFSAAVQDTEESGEDTASAALISGIKEAVRPSDSIIR